MKKYSKYLKYFPLLALYIAVANSQSVYAMHIMEGFLPKKWALIWFIIAAPFVIYGLKRITEIGKNDPDKKLLLALAGAFVFLLSSLKLPSVTGSCSHPTGVGLGITLFGPAPMFVLGTIVLIFQALLLAHGGLTTLGANAFSMAIAGPIVGYLVYKGLRKAGVKDLVAVFITATIADLFTYIVTSFQLGLAFPAGNMMGEVVKYLAIFATTQVPIAIMEGILTTLIYDKVKEYGGAGELVEKIN